MTHDSSGFTKTASNQLKDGVLTTAGLEVQVAVNPVSVTERSVANSTIKKPVEVVQLCGLGIELPLCRRICCLVPQSASVQELSVK